MLTRTILRLDLFRLVETRSACGHLSTKGSLAGPFAMDLGPWALERCRERRVSLVDVLDLAHDRAPPLRSAGSVTVGVHPRPQDLPVLVRGTPWSGPRGCFPRVATSIRPGGAPPLVLDLWSGSIQTWCFPLVGGPGGVERMWCLEIRTPKITTTQVDTTLPSPPLTHTNQDHWDRGSMQYKADASAADGEDGTPDGKAKKSIQPMRILLVEDDATTLAVVKMLLGQCGYEGERCQKSRRTSGCLACA
eukprot:scaffold287_cov337-Pavlova_lutheri.AAC.10